jgi:hypothetical protein
VTEDSGDRGGLQEYTDLFLESAHRAVLDLCARRGAELESLGCDVATGDGGDGDSDGDGDGRVVVAATTVVRFRGRRCVFRRGIWPPDHPAVTRAAVYASVLEERLLTQVLPGTGAGAGTKAGTGNRGDDALSSDAPSIEL